MATCKECKCFFSRQEDENQGDCVRREQDPRQAFYQAKPVTADRDASACPDFQKK